MASKIVEMENMEEFVKTVHEYLRNGSIVLVEPNANYAVIHEIPNVNVP